MILKRKRRMKPPTALAAIAVIVLAMLQHAAYAQTKAQARASAPRKTSAIPAPSVVLHPGEIPIIKFDSAVFDFGRVRAGMPVKHDFVFTNTGNGALEILKAKAG